ncbi:MAG: Flp pilus assembly complex ATPase component TadA [Puniceicoccales bacterium]|nr:Flp pilus assembly complex ATPase component TadA [Puniceicoccales bacterium]
MEFSGEGLPDRLLREIVADAGRRRASDVHLEPGEGQLRVRLRVDGRLIPGRILHPSLREALLRRLKVLSGLALDISQLPQDGKWLLECDGEPWDIRVSTIPFLHGEGAVLRLLRRPSLDQGLTALGYSPAAAAAIDALLAGPDGLFLFVGPTGCGKSTSAHAILHGLAGGRRKILSIEDPVEYSQKGVQAVAVAPEQGLSFASALRAVLRQSPDVLFLGEIRDGETAAVAVQAALTSHRVLGTLHCRDSSEAVPRLRQLGVASDLLHAALKGVLAQRLVRRLCPHCRTPRLPAIALARWLRLDPSRPLFHPTGCARCDGRGFLGQTVLWELGNLRRRTSPDQPPDRSTLWNCLRERVLAGETTAEEGYATLWPISS